MRIRAPGRICLFGEHQDYLGYPVIAAAIDKYVFIESQTLSEPSFKIYMPDVGKSMQIPLESQIDLPYQNARDYLKSSYNILRREGFIWKTESMKGFEVKLSGNLPINAGASSSSAMIVAWLTFLTKMTHNDISAEKIAEFAFWAEVKEFNESGGMMDHFTSALGGLIFMETSPKFHPIRIKYIEENFKQSFILIDSNQKKDTVEDLRKVKNKALKAFNAISKVIPHFNQFSTSLSEIEPFLKEIDNELRTILKANIINRDLTMKGLPLLVKAENSLLSLAEKEILGSLILEHQYQLSHHLGISTKKIDELIEFCVNNGACGAKINGSGFGGTFFAYCSNSIYRDNLIKKLKERNITFYPIEISEGAGEY